MFFSVSFIIVIVGRFDPRTAILSAWFLNASASNTIVRCASTSPSFRAFLKFLMSFFNRSVALINFVVAVKFSFSSHTVATGASSSTVVKYRVYSFSANFFFPTILNSPSTRNNFCVIFSIFFFPLVVLRLFFWAWTRSFNRPTRSFGYVPDFFLIW